MITAALGGKGTVTVKTGKATTKADVEVRSAQEGGDCIVFDKSSVTIKAGKTATVKVSKPKNAGAISWSVPGSPAGFLLSFGERGGIIGIWEMWEREWEHHGVERYGNERASCLLLNIH